MKSPIVSIIVPIYDVEQYLRQCVDSICDQTYSQLEIILVDDGSPDDCGAICDKYARSDPRVIVIHKKNGGLSSARNAGLDIATGTYVALIDGDDTIHPRFIEILVGLCEKYKCDIAQCDFLTVSEQSVKLPLNSQRPLLFYTGRQILHEFCTGKDNINTIVWNKLYRRGLFDETRYPLGKIHEDEFTTYKILWKSRKMVITNQYLYYYLQRQKSITGRKYSIRRLDALDAFKERLDFLKVNKLEEEYIATVRKYVALIDRSCALLKENVENCEEVCDALIKEKQQLERGSSPIFALKKPIFQPEWTTDTCPYPKNARIVLYGAGRWGRAYYQWIHENHWGMVVGWVDNFWIWIKDTGFPVSSLDSLLSMSYDYVLIAIQSWKLQEEIIENLRCWGISERKILTI